MDNKYNYFILIEELLTLIWAFEQTRLEYALCGGLAVGVYGYTRSTKDIDILIESESLEAVKKVARQCGFTFEPGLMKFKHATIYRFTKVHEHGDVLPLDFLFVTPQIRRVWEDRQAIQLEGGQTIVVVSPEGLIEMKRLRNELQDRVDIEYLQQFL